MASESRLETLHSKATDSAGEIVYRASPLPPGTRLDNFHIDHLIDESAAGYTYSANDGRLIIQEYFPQQISVRDIDGVSVLLCDVTVDEEYQRGLSTFLLLARVLSQIDHPGRVTHYQEKNDTAYYVVQLEHRTTWADLLSTGQRLPEETLRSVLLSVANYLEVAHTAGLFHLQLQPGHLLLSENEEVVVTNFNSSGIELPTHPLTFRSPFRAPEQSGTGLAVGAWTDYYSLGALLYQGAMRIPPAEATRRQRETNEGRPDPLVKACDAGKGYYGDSLLQIIDQLLTLDAQNRPDSAALIARAFGSGPSIDDEDERNRPLLAIGRAFSRLTARPSADDLISDPVPPLEPPTNSEVAPLSNEELPALAAEPPLQTESPNLNRKADGASAVVLSALEKQLRPNQTDTAMPPRTDQSRSESAIENSTTTQEDIPTLTTAAQVDADSASSQTPARQVADERNPTRHIQQSTPTMNDHNGLDTTVVDATNSPSEPPIKLPLEAEPPTLTVHAQGNAARLGGDHTTDFNGHQSTRTPSTEDVQMPALARRRGLKLLAWLVALTAIGVITFVGLRFYESSPRTIPPTRIDVQTTGSRSPSDQGLVSAASASTSVPVNESFHTELQTTDMTLNTVEPDSPFGQAIAAYYGADYDKAYHLLWPLAAEKNLHAQFLIGLILARNLGSTANATEGKSLLAKILPAIRMQAEEGEAWAQAALADYFTDGFTVTQNYKQSAFWYRKAALQGHAGAKNNLAWLYMHGFGVEPNAGAALRLFRAAARQDVYHARQNLIVLEGPSPGAHN